MSSLFWYLASIKTQNTLLTFAATEFCNCSSAFASFFCSNSMGSFNLNLVYIQLFTQCIFKQFFCVVPRSFFIFWYRRDLSSKFRSFSFNSLCTCCMYSTCVIRSSFWSFFKSSPRICCHQCLDTSVDFVLTRLRLLRLFFFSFSFISMM